MWDEADFLSDDPFVRYQAHQEAKGRPTFPDPDRVRKAQKENWPAPFRCPECDGTVEHCPGCGSDVHLPFWP